MTMTLRLLLQKQTFDCITAADETHCLLTVDLLLNFRVGHFLKWSYPCIFDFAQRLWLLNLHMLHIA